MIRVLLNGEPREIDERVTLADLCRVLALPERGTAVAVNLALIPRSAHESTTLCDGDAIDVVTASAGG
jgi:sulfur carrier protein